MKTTPHADANINVFVCDIRSLLHLIYDNDDDPSHHKNKNNTVITI